MSLLSRSRSLRETRAAMASNPMLRRNRVLADAGLDRSLRIDGYAITQLISPSAAAGLRSTFGELHGWSRQQLADYQPPDFEGDFSSHDLDYRRSVAEAIDERSSDAISALFRHHRPVARAFLTKWPIEPGMPGWDGVPDRFHNDTTYVDERTGARSFMVWLALQDTSPDNGTLQLVPGSHLLPRTIRGLDLDAPWLEHADVYRRRAIDITLRAGEAVAFDPAIVHRSGPNRASEPRVVASILLTEPGQQLCYFRRRDDETAEQVLVPPDFMTTALAEDLPSASATTSFPYTAPTLSAAQVARRLDAVSVVRRGRSVIGQSSSRLRRPMETQGAPVLTDAEHDRMLRSEGYTVLPGVDRRLCADALARYAELRGNEGREFEPDLTNPDSAYRVAVGRTLDEIFGDSVRSRFDAYEPFLWNYLCKWPRGTESLYLHRDWMFVDEPAGQRSYLAWIPLQDVGGENGVLRVLPRSHTIAGELSGTGLQPAWLQHGAEIEARLVDVPVQAGDVVVLDHALVHCSYPNRTGVPRVVAACALRPATAELVHFRRVDDATALRYVVDDTFFTTYTPDSLIEQAPPIAEHDAVPAPERNLSGTALAGLLDR